MHITTNLHYVYIHTMRKCRNHDNLSVSQTQSGSQSILQYQKANLTDKEDNLF